MNAINNGKIKFQLGSLYGCTKAYYLKAIEYFNKALEINPEHAEAWLFKGRTINELHSFEAKERDERGYWDEELTNIEPGVFKCYEKAFELDPIKDIDNWSKKIDSSSKEALMNKNFNLKKFAEIKRFNEALKINPKDETAWINKGHCLSEVWFYNEAMKRWDEALKINPKYVYAWYFKGRTLWFLGQARETLACMEEALRIDPGFIAAQQLKNEIFQTGEM